MFQKMGNFFYDMSKKLLGDGSSNGVRKLSVCVFSIGLFWLTFIFSMILSACDKHGLSDTVLSAILALIATLATGFYATNAISKKYQNGNSVPPNSNQNQ